jgi:hypothetical protein
MLQKVFTIYDAKAEAYLPPFYMKTTGEAERAVTMHVNEQDHNFNKFAEDFTLFELGEFDNENGQFNLLATPHAISVLVHYKRQSDGN